MDRWQTTMLAVVSIALLASIINISSPTPALAHGHWNRDGDFNLQHGSDLDSDEMQIRPLSADSLSAESTSNTEEGQRPVASETIQMMPISEVCGDGIDNDGDTLVDFSDEQCNATEPQHHQQQQQPILQQEPVVVSGEEICYDDLDNDFDGKFDSRDEECSYITSSTSAFPTPGQAEPVTDEETEREDEEDEQQSDDEGNDDDEDDDGRQDDS